MGITASGGAIGQALIPHLSGYLIESSGWQSAYFSLAIIYAVIAIPICFLVKESPWRESARTEAESEVRDFPISEKEVVTWISVAVIFCCICMAVPIVHLVPLLTDASFSLEFATSVLMVLMFCGAFGRILGGMLGDVIGALPAYILMSIGQTVSVVWFPHISTPLGIYFLAAFFGFTYSGVMSSILVCTRDDGVSKICCQSNESDIIFWMDRHGSWRFFWRLLFLICTVIMLGRLLLQELWGF